VLIIEVELLKNKIIAVCILFHVNIVGLVYITNTKGMSISGLVEKKNS